MTRLMWLGHSCLLFDSDGTHVLIDPFLTGNPAAARPAADVPADFVLVTHGHGDHLGDTIAIAKRTGATVVCNHEISEWLAAKGLPKVHGMAHGGGYTFPFGRVKMTVAFHGSNLPDGSYGGNPAGFHVTFKDGTRAYHAGDTALFSDMRLIGEDGVDFAALPIGDNYTMGPDDALKAVRFLGARRVAPVHFDTFPVIRQDAAAWAARVRAEAGADAVVLKAGEWLSL